MCRKKRASSLLLGILDSCFWTQLSISSEKLLVQPKISDFYSSFDSTKRILNHVYVKQQLTEMVKKLASPAKIEDSSGKIVSRKILTQATELLSKESNILTPITSLLAVAKERNADFAKAKVVGGDFLVESSEEIVNVNIDRYSPGFARNEPNQFKSMRLDSNGVPLNPEPLVSVKRDENGQVVPPTDLTGIDLYDDSEVLFNGQIGFGRPVSEINFLSDNPAVNMFSPGLVSSTTEAPNLAAYQPIIDQQHINGYFEERVMDFIQNGEIIRSKYKTYVFPKTEEKIRDYWARF